MYYVSNSQKIRLTLDVSGQIKHLIWVENLMEWQLFTTQPRQPCEVYVGILLKNENGYCPTLEKC